MMGQNRVIFYSRNDGSVYSNLLKIEQLLSKFGRIEIQSINDLLELNHVKQYLDNGIFLNEWNEELKSNLFKMSEEGNHELLKYFLKIDDTFILNDLGSIDYNFRKTYWNQLQFFEGYKKLTAQGFKDAIMQHQHHLYYILQNKKLVTHFNNEIRQLIIQYSESAEILLRAKEEKTSSISDKIHFPESLTLTDKENIIIDYLNSDNPNLNYIDLIQNVKDSDQIKLSAKTRLLAKNKKNEIKKGFSKINSGTGIGIEIGFVKTQVEPFKEEYHNLQTKLNYSVPYLDSLKDSLSLFHCFRLLFGFIDSQSLIPLVSKPAELQVIERYRMESKNSYPEGFMFHFKMMKSDAQIFAFQAYLKHRNISIEVIASDFVNHYLNPTLGLKNLILKFPDDTLDDLTKIRMLAPEMENILRQFQLFVLEGSINIDLLQMSSDPLYFGNINSLVNPKYYYAQNEEISTLQHIFFSDQSQILYTDVYQNKHRNFFELIRNERVRYTDFQEYQRDLINLLIEQKHLQLDEDNVVLITNPLEIYLCGLLFHDGGINYTKHPINVRDTIDSMRKKGWVIEDNTLLSKQELDYFNYYLNKKKFTNGFDIRNKYLHGTNNQSEATHQADYFSLLKLTILLLLKIEDDLLTANFKYKNAEIKE
jgi:hypothetical protein